MTDEHRSKTGPAPEYRKLMAILDTTKDRVHPLFAEIHGNPQGLWFAICQRTGPKGASGGIKRLVAVPFDPMNPDDAARDASRRLTLDGGLPTGME